MLSLGGTGPGGEEFYKSLAWLYYNPYGSTRNQQDFNSTVRGVDGFKSCTEDVNYVIEVVPKSIERLRNISPFENGWKY